MPHNDSLNVWISHLTVLQTRALQLNNGTPQDVAAFAKTRPSLLLPTDLQKRNLQQFFQQRTDITIDLADMGTAATFASLLDAYTTPLLTCVEIRMRAVAGGANLTLNLDDFGKLKTATLYLGAAAEALVETLDDGTGNLLKLGQLKATLRAAATTVLDATKSVLP